LITAAAALLDLCGAALDSHCAMWIGTTNPGKTAEIAGILSPMGIELRPLALDVEETEDTFEGNARLKACAYARHARGVAISEDSGLCIAALGGLPGAWSARFSDCELAPGFRVARVVASGRERDEIDRANNQRVLELMKDVRDPLRAAVFKVRLVVADAERILFEEGAEAHGWIAPEARGERGFGYDPIFVGGDTFGKTYAELDPIRKNARSHRKKVLAAFQYWIAGELRAERLRASD
jgi:XTP/dITP diphosphohydrolase